MNQVQPRINRVSGFLCIAIAIISLMISASKPACASMPVGYYDYGASGVIVMYSGDARNFGDLLAKTNKTQDTLNQLAKVLSRYAPLPVAWNFARLICYNGINSAMRNAIYWCSYHSDRVYIYTFYGIPYRAAPG